MSKPAPQFLVKYNDFILPGYAQGESFEDAVNITDYSAPYSSDPISEQSGEVAKNITVTMKVWDDDYYSCRDQINLAATYLKSKRTGYGKLYLGKSDRYYQVIPVDIKYAKASTDNYKLSQYDVTFKAKAYAESDATYYLTVSGNTVGSTDSATPLLRSTSDGIPSPCFMKIHGGHTTTISGYTSTGEFCGFLVVSGAGNEIWVNSSTYEATDPSLVNKNSQMVTPDYTMYVGVGKTLFNCSGATSVEFSWKDRWVF